MLDDRSIYLRRLVLRAMKSGRRGHWGSSASLIEIMRVLYDDVAKHGMKEKKDRDRIILSKGHGVLAQVVLLADKGYLPLNALDSFCKKEGIIGGHPSPDHLPGVECHTGALGHGLSIGIGMAIAAKIKKQSHRIFVICGDGECNEGSIWEAAMSASKHKLDNLTVIIDYNKIQSSGRVEDIQPLEPFADKWRAFGFSTYECDGHDVGRLRVELEQRYSKPNCIIAHTVKSRGIKFAEGNPLWHYKSNLTDEQLNEMEDALTNA